GRTNEVREHHRDLPALGGVLGLRLCFYSGGFTCYRRGAGQLTDGREHFAPMPKQHTDVLEISIGQITQYRDIDPVFCKARGVLGQAELFEPVRDLLHRDPSSRRSNRVSGRGREGVYRRIRLRYITRPSKPKTLKGMMGRAARARHVCAFSLRSTARRANWTRRSVKKGELPTNRASGRS